MKILGIDPGLSGALALIERDPTSGALSLVWAADMPTVTHKTNAKKNKTEINLALLADLIQPPGFDAPDLCVIEFVHAMPGQGVTSMFNFGYAAGAAAGVVSALRVPLRFIKPLTWQRAVNVTKDQAAARLTASRLYPDQAHLFTRVKDGGRADATLIATAAAQELPL
jgi:crossover junction endodeoxyribonuclease RuvC